MQFLATVLGAGSWGTALALLLAEQGDPICLWDRNADHIHNLHKKRENIRYLPGYRLPQNIILDADIEDAVTLVPMVVLAIPASGFRSVLSKIILAPESILVLTTKGMEEGTGLLPAEIVAQLLPNQACVALSGPNLATEVARGVPAAAVAASPIIAHAKTVRDTFSLASFRVYTSDDLMGVEVGGAIKNVLAIAGGISDGLGYGDNTKAALLTRGLAEMARFGVACGARRETFYGLSGVGDLMATASSKLSRNWRVGSALARGEHLPDILSRLDQVAEGVLTAQIVVERARLLGIEMPVCETVAEMLNANITPREAVRKLMTRQAGEE